MEKEAGEFSLPFFYLCDNTPAHVIVANSCCSSQRLFKVLNWILERSDYDSIKEWVISDAIVVALFLGRQDVVQVLVQMFGGAHFTPYLAAFSCASGNLDFVKWCTSQLPSGALDSQNASLAASACGHLHVLDWLKANQVGFGHDLYQDAIALHVRRGVSDSLLQYDQLKPLEPWANCVRGSTFKYSNPIHVACAIGQLDVLKWWFSWVGTGTGRHDVKWITQGWADAGTIASAKNQVGILEWLDKNGLIELSISAETVETITVKGHVAVLDWWKAKYCQAGQLAGFLAIPSLFTESHSNTPSHLGFKWWQEEVAAIDVCPFAKCQMWYATRHRQLDQALWWCQVLHMFGGEFTQATGLSSLTTSYGMVEVLDWITLNLPLSHPVFNELDLFQYVLYFESQVPSHVKFDTLLWLMQSGLDLTPLGQKFEIDSWLENGYPSSGDCLLLDTYRKAGFRATRQFDLDFFSDCENIPLLDWGLKYSKLEVVYTESALIHPTHQDQFMILEWWKQSGLPIKFDKATLANLNQSSEVVEWWEESGFLPTD